MTTHYRCSECHMPTQVSEHNPTLAGLHHTGGGRLCGGTQAAPQIAWLGIADGCSATRHGTISAAKRHGCTCRDALDRRNAQHQKQRANQTRAAGRSNPGKTMKNFDLRLIGRSRKLHRTGTA